MQPRQRIVEPLICNLMSYLEVQLEVRMTWEAVLSREKPQIPDKCESYVTNVTKVVTF
jgi:hypothetical protein